MVCYSVGEVVACSPHDWDDGDVGWNREFFVSMQKSRISVFTFKWIYHTMVALAPLLSCFEGDQLHFFKEYMLYDVKQVPLTQAHEADLLMHFCRLCSLEEDKVETQCAEKTV